MRSFIPLFFMLLGAINNVLAQTRNDLIYKIDQTSFATNVDEIGESEITYFLPNDALKQHPQRIAKIQVWKIVFANGDTEEINQPQQSRAPTPVIVVTDKDRIIYKNGSIIEATVTKVGERTVEYRNKGEANPVYEVEIGELNRIEYANGEIEKFAKKLTVKPVKSTDKEGNVNDAKHYAKPSLAKSTLIKKTSNNERDLFAIVLGGEGAYVLGTKEWTDEKRGMGMGLGIGVSASMSVFLSRWLSVTVSGGLLQWEVEYNFRDSLSRDLLMRRNNVIKMVPLNAGLKIYPFKGFYLSPQINYTLYQETGVDYDPSTEVTTKFFGYKGNKLGYRGEIGYERRGKGLRWQIGVYYSTLLIDNLKEFKKIDPITFVGTRLAIGFGL